VFALHAISVGGTIGPMTQPAASPTSSLDRRYRRGFVGVALAFATVIGFTTVPTPLWSLFARRDGFSSLTVTVVFAAYAVGVAVSLFLVGHMSDAYGRRRVLVPALSLNIVASALFLLWPALTGLLVARVISGLGIGATTATATAWLVELRGAYAGDRDPGRGERVAGAANLVGLGAGALVSGALAQWAGHPLTTPFAVFAAALLIALALVLNAPETRRPAQPRPAYRPQRVSVPAAARGRFLAAATGATITFALFGLLTSLAPSFLAGTLGDPSHALAGAVSFAVFAAAAVAQTLSGSRTPRQLLLPAIPALLLGLGLLTLAVWLPRPSLAVFVAGVLIGGAGGGLLFKGALATAAALAVPQRRAEALAGVFLAAYIGLAAPVIGLGVLTQILTAQVSLLVFAGLLAGSILLATPRLLGRDDSTPRRPSPRRRPYRWHRPAPDLHQAISK
jgi:MFS family permease